MATRIWGWSRDLATGAPTPGATISVFNTGTLVLATIFADDAATPKANPFTSDSNAYWFFYGTARYDVQVVATGFTTYTLGDLSAPGLRSLNGLLGDVQTFAVGSGGTDFAISSAGTVHTFNIPSASAANRGLVTTGVQTLAGAKTLSSLLTLQAGLTISAGAISAISATLSTTLAVSGAFTNPSATSPVFGAVPTFTPGTGSDLASANGVINAQTTQADSVGGLGETDLMTYSLKAGTLSAAGKTVRVVVWGTTAANTAAKTVKVYFGATSLQVFSGSGTGVQSCAWSAEFYVTRIGNTTQRMIMRGLLFNSLSDSPVTRLGSPTETLSGAVTIKTTGLGPTNADVSQFGMIVEVLG